MKIVFVYAAISETGFNIAKRCILYRQIHPGLCLLSAVCKKNDLSLIDDTDDFVSYPEVDKPKIKDIDYDFMRKMAVEAKKLSLRVKARIRLERALIHKKNKEFRTGFEKELM